MAKRCWRNSIGGWGTNGRARSCFLAYAALVIFDASHRHKNSFFNKLHAVLYSVGLIALHSGVCLAE